MADKVLRHTTLLVKERSSVTLDGVENVLGFDESYVTLGTVAGKIIIEGEGLKIESLTKESGEILVSGRITSVLYEQPGGVRTGLLSRFFK